MDDDFYTNVLNDNKDAIKARVTESMLESISQKFKWELPRQLSAEVDEFVKEHVLPEVRAELLENKDRIVEAATTTARAAALEAGKALQEQAAKNMTQSWNVKKLASALFD